MLSQIVDLDGVTHSKKIRDSGSFSVTLGLVPDSVLKQIKSEVRKDEVYVVLFDEAYMHTSLSVSASASYIDGTEVYWTNVSITGVRK